MFLCFIRIQGAFVQNTDKNTYISKLQERALAMVEARDWQQFHTAKEMAINLSVESAELLELFIFKNNEEVSKLLESDAHFKERVAEELGDVFLTTLLFARYAGLDVTTAFCEKLKKVEQKYPIEKAKGRNKKYNEL
jgi:NTP pyrophosphatase (non-canonical NTP hydrolase)